MSDLISRKEAWKAFDECNLFVNREDRDIAQEVIENLPPVEAKPMIKGEWKMKVRNNGGYVASITCSVCGYAHSRVTYNFCPECGADMRSGKNE